MRTALLISIIAILFTSCSKYQYLTIAGENISKDEKQEFVTENDTFRITYNFYGNKGPVRISIHNKSNKTLEVDWKRSSVIFGESSTGYYNPDLQITGEVEKNGYSRNSNSSINATISGSEALEFIPPQASVSRHNIFLQSRAIKNIAFEKKEKLTKTGITTKKVNRVSFLKDNSPVVFRSYVTLILDGNSSFAVDHSFYITDILETGTGPDKFQDHGGDKFYIRGKSGFGKMSGIFTGIGLLGLLFLGAQ